MKKIVPSGAIYCKNSNIPHGGRGVFASKVIKKGELIERCPYIDIPSHELDHITQSFLVTYIFFYGEDKSRLLLVLGFGSMYNHSHFPNATYEINDDEGVMDFTATQDIKMDEEVTFDYKSGNPQSKSPLWFE